MTLPTLPNEVSRVAKVTAKGTPYEEIGVRPYGTTDPAIVLAPNTISLDVPGINVMAHHGSGGSEQTVNTPNMISSRDAMLDRGWSIGSAFGYNRAWGNDAALGAIEALSEYIGEFVSQVTDTLFHGQSMGAQTLAVMYAQNRIPNVRGLASVDGALNLAAAFAHPAHRPSITAAYGIDSSGSDFAVKTAGHDPCQIPASVFADKNFVLWASPDDTSIPKSQHADVFAGRVNPVADNFALYPVTGGHVTASHYQPVPLMAFYDLCLGNDPVVIPDFLGYSPFYWDGALQAWRLCDVLGTNSANEWQAMSSEQN